MLQHIKLYSVPLTSHVFYYFQTFRHIISYVYVFFMTYSIWLITIHSRPHLDVISELITAKISSSTFSVVQLNTFSICFYSPVSSISGEILDNITLSWGAYQYLSLNYNCSGTVWVMFALYFQYPSMVFGTQNILSKLLLRAVFSLQLQSKIGHGG